MNLSEAIEHFFRDPAAPTIPRTEAWLKARRALPELPPEAAWYGTELPVRQGAVFTLDGAQLDFPEGYADRRWWVFYADPDPYAKWGHPMYWVFVPPEVWLDPSRNLRWVEVRDSTMPPHGDGPARWFSLT